ncbi:MAG: glycoside hydrolase family 3 N-terminal domain-containing protein [Pyrinomonadaceae bacterium]
MDRSTENESLAYKAGRLLFVGLPEPHLDTEQRELLREVRPGGVILFGRNVESAAQVAALTTEVREVLGRRVLIGVDQEGGLVDRFRHICEPMPAAKAIRDAGSSELARQFGRLSARAMRLLGFNINFAPVLDLGGDNEENGLRARTFGHNPGSVSRLAGAYLEGLQGAGVLGCGKHFPGLGGAQVDSHRRLPIVTNSWEEIFERDLVPFMDLMFHRRGERLHTLMISHAAFPEVSGFLQAWFRRTADLPALESLHQLPATISGNVVMRLLRQVLKFDGLVITDDMEMGAVVETLSVAEASLRAFEAGSDMVLICERADNFIAARDQLVEAVKSGRVKSDLLERANERLGRVLDLGGEDVSFDGDEFAIICRGIAGLKRELRAAECGEEYTPLYGTDGGNARRSSNF